MTVDQDTSQSGHVLIPKHAQIGYILCFDFSALEFSRFPPLQFRFLRNSFYFQFSNKAGPIGIGIQPSPNPNPF